MTDLQLYAIANNSRYHKWKKRSGTVSAAMVRLHSCSNYQETGRSLQDENAASLLLMATTAFMSNHSSSANAWLDGPEKKIVSYPLDQERYIDSGSEKVMHPNVVQVQKGFRKWYRGGV